MIAVQTCTGHHYERWRASAMEQEGAAWMSTATMLCSHPLVPGSGGAVLGAGLHRQVVTWRALIQVVGIAGVCQGAVPGGLLPCEPVLEEVGEMGVGVGVADVAIAYGGAIGEVVLVVDPL